MGGVLRPGIVHRIDKDTSGLIVVAKSDAAHQGLAAQFAAHSHRPAPTSRWCTAARPGQQRPEGVSWEPGGVLRIEGAIGRHPGDRKSMAVLSTAGQVRGDAGAGARSASVATAPAALVECRLETGRTHQIRVHMAIRGPSAARRPAYTAARPARSSRARRCTRRGSGSSIR